MSEQIFTNCTSGGPVFVYVKDGRIVRIRPLVFKEEDDAPSWTIEAVYDPLEPGKPGSIDRGGCINLLTPSRTLAKNIPGMAPNTCLIEIEKWDE